MGLLKKIANHLTHLGWAIICVLLLGGCVLKSDPNTTTFKVKTTRKTNHGTPIYVLVRSTDVVTFLLDDYEEIASRVFLKKDKDSHIYTACLLPGKTKTFKVKTEDGESAAVYFLFTNPGEDWKHIVKADQGKRVRILLGKDEISSVTAFGT